MHSDRTIISINNFKSIYESSTALPGLMETVYPPANFYSELLSINEAENVFNIFARTSNSPQRVEWLDFIARAFEHRGVNLSIVPWDRVKGIGKLFTAENILSFDTSYLWVSFLIAYRNTNSSKAYDDFLKKIILTIVSNTTNFTAQKFNEKIIFQQAISISIETLSSEEDIEILNLILNKAISLENIAELIDLSLIAQTGLLSVDIIFFSMMFKHFDFAKTLCKLLNVSISNYLCQLIETAINGMIELTDFAANSLLETLLPTISDLILVTSPEEISMDKVRKYHINLLLTALLQQKVDCTALTIKHTVNIYEINISYSEFEINISHTNDNTAPSR